MGIVDSLLTGQLTPYATVVGKGGENTVMDGDIMLASGTYGFSELIKLGTKSPWSHCAMIFRLDSIGRVVVLESVESSGLRAVPLSSYVEDYQGDGKPYQGTVVIARSQALRRLLDETADNVKNITGLGFDDLGHPYATQDIAHIAARIAAGAIGIKDNEALEPKPGVYICSEFVDACVRQIGLEVTPCNFGFVAPSDVAAFCDKPVARIDRAECRAPLAGNAAGARRSSTWYRAPP
jgi:hypothetical protein